MAGCMTSSLYWADCGAVLWAQPHPLEGVSVAVTACMCRGYCHLLYRVHPELRRVGGLRHASHHDPITYIGIITMTIVIIIVMQ